MSNFIINPYSFATCTTGNYASTTLLLHMNGTDGGTTFTDDSSSGLSPSSVNGNAQTDTDRFQFGTAAMLMDASGDYLEYANNAAFELGSGDFTMDAWIYVDSASAGERGIIGHGWNTGADGEFAWRCNNNDASTVTLSLDINRSGVPTAFNGAAGGVNKDEWVWVGAKRSGNNMTLWVNGSQSGSTHDWTGDTLGGNSDTLQIGRSNVATFDGSIDELRLVKGSAEDLSVVPTQPYCDS